VVDRRLVSPVPGTRMSILRRTSEVRDARTGGPIGQAHAYGKLIVLHTLLTRQFADAGLELTNLGGVADLSPYSYSRERISRKDDLGMLGEPDCFYRAIKV
jgi:hypothetical protein